ncbi:MAG: iron-containing alcohol dehydrogenase, partial [Lachnospiraceae bacterium]|nr:iron-containing alcohol dehydrogenase [Lachnospiraceae bacterium]
MILTTLCYIEKNGAYLMLHRTKKENDLNAGKYIAPGGHIEAGETPFECVIREVKEETGLSIYEPVLRGIVRFISPSEEEEMFVYTADSYEGEMSECDEGDLKWVDFSDIMSLNLWEGDRKFLKLLIEGADYFRMTLRYDGEGRLIDGEDPLLLQTDGAVSLLPQLFSGEKYKNALIVTGRHSAIACGALSDVEAALGKTGVSCSIYDKVEENPSVETVYEAAQMGRDAEADFVIAVGGGSPMDAAKAAALLIKNKDKGIDYLYEKGNPSDYIPVICVPTTCGTGSEATGVSVLSRPDIRAKGSIPYRIWPIIGLMDDRYLKNAPASIIRNTAIDALAHMCESYVNTKADDISRAFVMEGLKIWSMAKDELSG